MMMHYIVKSLCKSYFMGHPAKYTYTISPLAWQPPSYHCGSKYCYNQHRSSLVPRLLRSPANNFRCLSHPMIQTMTKSVLLKKTKIHHTIFNTHLGFTLEIIGASPTLVSSMLNCVLSIMNKCTDHHTHTCTRRMQGIVGLVSLSYYC